MKNLNLEASEHKQKQNISADHRPSLHSELSCPEPKSSGLNSLSLKHLSNPELLTQTQALVHQERRLGVEILWHLREIESRRLYAERGYSSLHTYCVQELKYSDGAAHRRISAMRLLKDLPEVEEKIQSGALSLSTAATLQDFLRAEKRGSP
jgi:hypothetical protein